jgi:glycerophosphoryl diester phosphodiesterase
MVASAITSTAVTVPADAAGHRVRPHTDTPLVIGHRGAPGYRPEHTLASYQLAIDMGADYIEPDLVSTKDGVLVARHENEISGTTDVAGHSEFADRRTTKTIDGKRVTGWFTEDFTLAELRTLRAKERLPQVRPDNTRYDGKFEVPTFEEVLDLAARESGRRGVTIGVYPETKHPSYFDSIGLSLEEPLVAALRRHHLDRPNAPVFVQSFEEANLQKLYHEVKVPLVRLVDADQGTLVTPAGLRHIATYADAVGADKELVLPCDADGNAGRPSDLVQDAHAAGLDVHVWTMRDENQFMAQNFRRGDDPNAKGDAGAELKAFLDAGVDAVFTDYSDTAVEARRQWEAEGEEPAA